MAGKFSIEAIFKGNDQISKVIAGIEGRVGKFSAGVSGGLKEIGKINDKIASGFVDIAKKAAVVGAVLGGLTVAGLTQVVHAGADFEQAITNVGAVSGKSLSQISDLKDAALSLGVTTQFSATEVANGMEMMARKGFTTQEILQGIPGVLNAVAASGQDMAEVSNVIGSAIRGFGLQASEASHVANVLAFASARTGATITDLGTALSTAAPTARSLGVSIEDTTTAVGLLQKMGIDASTSGSALATMLAKISKPSHAAAQEMTSLGIKFQDAHGDMLPFRDVLGQFVKAGSKVGGNMKQMAFFAELVGLRGDKAALGLKAMAESGEFDKLAADIQHVGDFAGDVAKIRMDTTLGSWKLLTSTVEVLETKLFGLESGPLRKVVDGTNAWITANQGLIVSDVQGFIQGVSDDLPKVVIWAERIGKMVAVVGSFMLAVKIATGALALFNAVAAVNPWILLIYGLVALTAVVVAFWPEIKKHEKAFRQVGVTLAEVVAGVGFAASAYGAFLLVTNAGTIAAYAYAYGIYAVNGVMQLWAVATNIQSIKTAILTAAQWLQTGAVTAYNAVLGVGQGAIALFTGETVTMTGAMTAALGPVLALVAALGSLYLAKKLNDDLKANTGGMGIFDIAGSMIKDGTLNPFAVVDKHQNEQAREEARRRGENVAALPSVSVSPFMPPVPGIGAPALPGAVPGQDPQAMIAAILAQQGSTPGATSANGQAPAKSSKETGEALAAAMAPMLTEALNKGRGELVIKDETGRAQDNSSSSFGYRIRLQPSGGL